MKSIVLKKHFKWALSGITFLAFSSAFAQSPEEAALFKKGKELYSKRKYNQAISELSKAIKLNPKSPSSYYIRGNAYHRTGKLDLSVADYLTSIKLAPEDAGPYMGLGAVALNKGDVDQAMDYFNRALEYKPEFAEVYFDRALGYYMKKEYDKCWVDVHHAELLGWKVKPEFIKNLKKVSGRDK